MILWGRRNPPGSDALPFLPHLGKHMVPVCLWLLQLVMCFLPAKIVALEEKEQRETLAGEQGPCTAGLQS